MHDLILRGLGSQVQQAVAQRPTFVTVWIGNNDVLGAAVNATAIEGVTLTPTAVFRQTYAAIIAAVRATGAQAVAVNLPDVTSIPYTTTIKPYLVDPATGLPVTVGGQRVPLLGPSGPLPADALVTLAASSLLARGIGIPAAAGGTNQPLPGNVVLEPAETATIRNFVNTNNASIRDICAAASVPVLDLNSLLTEVATQGREIGGFTVTGAFLTGGVFSYDGVHPTDLGNGLVANEFVDVINEAFGGALPHVDLKPLAQAAAREGVVRAASVRHAGLPEFSPAAQDQLQALFPTLDPR
jgi:lysophospholipase L1-like esterase